MGNTGQFDFDTFIKKNNSEIQREVCHRKKIENNFMHVRDDVQSLL